MSTSADSVDDFIATKLRERNLPGLALAIIQDRQIIKNQGYGLTEKNGRTPVTPDTLFQAGSASKSLAAFGALRLVENRRLSLAGDVNDYLRRWQLPENEFTQTQKVTLGRILSHNAGLTVHGFPGYAGDEAIPSLVEILEGLKPAKTAAVRADMVPGGKARYSGGGYVVLQQMVQDVTGLPFPKFMRDTVLQPLGMTHSTFEQPLPSELMAAAASGHSVGGQPFSQPWHIYPEMAAAGLWTTAADLARFVIGIQQLLAASVNPLISPAMVREMLNRQADNHGLGVFLDGSEKKLRFYHGGRNRGFDALFMAQAHQGKGLVVLLNANDDAGTLREIVKFVAREYHW